MAGMARKQRFAARDISYAEARKLEAEALKAPKAPRTPAHRIGDLLESLGWTIRIRTQEVAKAQAFLAQQMGTYEACEIDRALFNLESVGTAPGDAAESKPGTSPGPRRGPAAVDSRPRPLTGPDNRQLSFPCTS